MYAALGIIVQRPQHLQLRFHVLLVPSELFLKAESQTTAHYALLEVIVRQAE
jgi:hypothetical protein